MIAYAYAYLVKVLTMIGCSCMSYCLVYNCFVPLDGIRLCGCGFECSGVALLGSVEITMSFAGLSIDGVSAGIVVE